MVWVFMADTSVLSPVYHFCSVIAMTCAKKDRILFGGAEKNEENGERCGQGAQNKKTILDTTPILINIEQKISETVEKNWDV